MPVPRLPRLELSRTVPKTVDVLVVGLTDNGAQPDLVGVPAATEKAAAKRFGPLSDLAVSLGATTKPGHTIVLPPLDGPRLLVVGLGEGDATPESLRRAAGAGIRAARDLGEQLAVSFDVDDLELLTGAAEGALLGAYRYAKLSGADPKPGPELITVVSEQASAAAKQAVADAAVVAEAVCLARDWVNTPANLLYPESFAADARAVLRDQKIAVDVLDERALEKEGFGGILAVGGGSTHPPRLLRLSYAPRGANFHLGLVGKGITFDAGGLNLKTSDGMYTMKTDMSGAATVLAATRAIARLGLRIKVTAYAAMAENLPSGSAYRPSDVLTMYGGTTVENGNCDAEGRLVMADALARASEDAPDLVIDVATLTGACVVALGERVAGLMTSDDPTADTLLDAAEAAGESFWQLPIPAEITEALTDSDVADLKSTGPRPGGALYAAAFLHRFVADIPWAHLDIAGPAYNTHAPYGYAPRGATGVGARTLISLARSLQG